MGHLILNIEISVPVARGKKDELPKLITHLSIYPYLLQNAQPFPPFAQYHFYLRVSGCTLIVQNN